jgi:3-oxoacyl-[acyl-carrier protein] reductase
MDLGISGRRAIVTAASRGLGLACARSLAREGVALTINARSAEALEAAGAAIRAEFGVPCPASPLISTRRGARRHSGGGGGRG